MVLVFTSGYLFLLLAIFVFFDIIALWHGQKKSFLAIFGLSLLFYIFSFHPKKMLVVGNAKMFFFLSAGEQNPFLARMLSVVVTSFEKKTYFFDWQIYDVVEK